MLQYKKCAGPAHLGLVGRHIAGEQQPGFLDKQKE
jgi:hypothetical protein